MSFGGSKNRVRVQGEYDDKISGPLAKTRDAFDRLGKNKGAQAVLQGVGMGAGIQAWDLLDKAMSGAIDVVGDSIGKASDLRESMALTDQVFERAAGKVEDWASATNDAFSKREALDFASEFGTAFKNVGLELDDVTTRAERMTTLAGDLGSAFNRSSEDAANALRSGLLGESEPLRAFGVFLDETKVKAKALAMGMKPVNGVFTDAQKVTARYQLILEQTADSQGMFGRDTESLADAQKLLATNVEDLEAKLGQKLVPALAHATSGVAEFTAEISRDGGELDQLGQVLDALGKTSLPGIADGMQRAQDESLTLQDRLRGTVDETAGALPLLGNYIRWLEDMALGEKDAGEAAVIMAADVKDAARAHQFAGDAMADLIPPAQDTAAMFDEIRKTAADGAKALDDLRRSTNDAMDALSASAFGPEQLRLKIEATTLELQKNRAELAKLGQIKNPTKDQQADMVDLRLRISEGEQSVFDLRGELGLLEGMTLDDVKRQISSLGGRLGDADDEARDLYRSMLQLNKVGLAGQGSHPNVTASLTARASGGPVVPGGTYTVGEDGQETLVMSPAGGGYVIPGAGGGSGHGSVTVNFNSLWPPTREQAREIAEVIDRELYYKAARAPQSSFAG